MQRFIERDMVVRPEFALEKADETFLIQIFQQMDRLSLTIELAAVRLWVLSLE